MKENSGAYARERLPRNIYFSHPTTMEETADLDLGEFFSPTLVDFVQRVTPDLEEQQEADIIIMKMSRKRSGGWMKVI